MEMAARIGRMRAEGDKFISEHEPLRALCAWLDGAEQTHELNSQNRTGSGLLLHLSTAWQWHTGAPGAEFRAQLGVPGSCTELGQLVDAELSALILGADIPPPHLYTHLVLDAFRAHQWLPVAAQVPLWHRSKTTYTFIDVLAYDCVNDRLVLIELKTGYDHGYDVPIADQASDSDMFVDSHRTRHQQQLCWMLVVLRAELPPETPLVGCVLRVSESAGVREPEWAEPELCAFFEQVYIEDEPAYSKVVAARKQSTSS